MQLKFLITLLFTYLFAINLQAQELIYPENPITKSLGKTVTSDVDGNVYFAGDYNNEIQLLGASLYAYDYPNDGATNGDVLIGKLNPSGQLLWLKSIGGINRDQVFDIEISPNGSVTIVGTFRGSIYIQGNELIGGNSNESFFVVDLDIEDGAYINAINSSGNSGSSDIESVVYDDEGSMYLSGSLYGSIVFLEDTIVSDNQSSSFLIKATKGNFDWVIQIKGNDNSGQGLYYDKSNEQIYQVGLFGGSFTVQDLSVRQIHNGHNTFLLSVKKDGRIEWIQSLQSDGEIHCYTVTGNDGYVYIGGELLKNLFLPNGDEILTRGYNDGVVVAYDHNGVYSYHTIIGGNREDEVVKLVYTNNALVVQFLMGDNAYCNGTNFDFDGFKTDAKISLDYTLQNIYNYNYVPVVDGSGQVFPKDFTLTQDNVFTIGQTVNSMLIDGVIYGGSPNFKDFYLIKDYFLIPSNLPSSPVIKLRSRFDIYELSLYPNPAYEGQIVYFNKYSLIDKVEIYDESGKYIKMFNLDLNTGFSTDSLSGGVFLIKGYHLNQLIGVSKLIVY